MRKHRNLRMMVLLVLLATLGCGEKIAPAVIQVASPAPPDTVLAREAGYDFMLDSYRQVGDLHTVVLCGDFQQLVDLQHWGILQEQDRRAPAKRTGCSMFQCRTDSGRTLVGRNFDHKFSETLVAWCYPDSGYASLSFIPLNQWGFDETRPFDPDDPTQKRFLLNGPVTTIEGMNEAGVVITLASLDRQETRAHPDKEPRFLIHLVREILDHAGSLEEAIGLAVRYNIFDNGRDIITHHIFLADPVAGSAVLEWQDGLMNILRKPQGHQVVTNSPLSDVGEKRRRQACPRYRTLARILDRAAGSINWQAGLRALAQAAQVDKSVIVQGEPWCVSTQWSTVFDLTERAAYVCLQGDFEVVYRLEVPVSKARGPQPSARGD